MHADDRDPAAGHPFRPQLLAYGRSWDRPLFTGSLNQHVACSGRWLAEHEYVIDDVNKWSFLALTGRRAGATSLATYGDLTRSARHRSHEAYGIEDELRAAFVADGTYWAAAGFLRDQGRPWFTEDDVRFLEHSPARSCTRGSRPTAGSR